MTDVTPGMLLEAVREIDPAGSWRLEPYALSPGRPETCLFRDEMRVAHLSTWPVGLRAQLHYVNPPLKVEGIGNYRPLEEAARLVVQHAQARRAA
jgi:hypothetical protein